MMGGWFRLNLSDATLIHQEATLIRRALEQIVHTLEGLQSFPRGACGKASVLLGEWLIRKGFEGVEFVSGSSDEFKNHAWLECDGLLSTSPQTSSIWSCRLYS